MAETLELEIYTPERPLLHEQVADVQLPAANGYLGILPGHAALLSRIGTGSLSYQVGGRRRFLVVDGGFVEVLNDHVRVLAELAEAAEEIDVNRARTELQTAQERLGKMDADNATALHDLELAQARLAAAEQK